MGEFLSGVETPFATLDLYSDRQADLEADPKALDWYAKILGL
jgi:hypothetical protein